MDKLEKIANTISKTPYSQIIIIFLVSIIYAQTIGFGFSYLDDNSIIVEQINKQKPVLNIAEAFKRDAFFTPKGLAFYRPIQNITFMFDSVIGNNKAFMYHLTNILIHLLTCLSLFHLFKLLKYDNVLSFAGVMIYAVHPLFTHAVAWIPSRGDLIIALLGILMFISFIKLIDTNDKKYLYLNILLYAIAGFTKETALLFPLIFYSYYFLINKKKKFNSNNYILLISYLVIILVYINLRSGVVIHQEGDDSFGLASFFKNIQALPEMFAKFFFPVHLSTMPMYSVLVSSIGTLLLIVTIGYLIKNRKQMNGMVVFSIFWFLLFSIPGMFYRHNYADVSYEYLEHRAYLPAIGLILFLFEIFKSKNIDLKKNTKLFFIVIALVVFFSGYTYLHSGNYRNIFSFYNCALNIEPRNAIAYYNLGNYFKENNNPEKAKVNFLKCIEVHPPYIEAYQNLAATYEMKDEHAKAIEYLNLALNINSNYTPALKMLGIIYNKLGQNQLAFNNLDRCLQLSPDDLEALNAMGVVYVDLNKYDLAEQTFKKILRIKSDYKLALDNLASMKKNKGEKSKVIQSLQQSVSTNPKSSEAYNSLGEEYGRQGNIEKAMEMLQKAIEIDPSNAKAYNNLGTAYAMTKQFTKAITMYSNAAKYDPQNSTYFLNYGLALSDNKQTKEAIEVMKKAAQLNNQVAIQWLRERGY